MNVLAIDVGSSSVKAGILRNGRVVKESRCAFETDFAGNRVEVDPDGLLNAVVRSTRALGTAARDADVISIDSMSPSWLAMDRRGKPVTPIVSHQDRRSLDIAMEIERRIGKERHLKITGTRPVPGGMSSTTCAWFLKHERSLMRRADLLGHATTFLHRQFAGVRVVDPSHASFMGLYSTLDLSGWSDEMCEAIGVSKKLLPDVLDADQIAGKIMPEAARLLGLRDGTPMLTGMIDTGAAVVLAGSRVGQLVNTVGTTDVLALCTDKPKPHPRLLTRALGVGKRWVSVGTIGAAGSSLLWAREQFFRDWSDQRFFKLVNKISREKSEGMVTFDPYLAGDRCSVEQRKAAFNGLTLSTTREQMLAAIVQALSRASAERFELLRWTGTPINRNVLISGGGGGALAELMHRDWPGKWTFKVEKDATLKGLEKLATETLK